MSEEGHVGRRGVGVGVGTSAIRAHKHHCVTPVAALTFNEFSAMYPLVDELLSTRNINTSTDW